MKDGWNGIYCGPAPLPGELWQSWNFDPWLLTALALLAFMSIRNTRALLAVAVLAIAFVSPLCALSAALFSARVVHHVLLVAVAAPLLALAWPARRSGSLPLGFAVSSAILWGWHAPPAYDLALSHVGVYWIMQLSLVLSALWFWRAIFARATSPVESITYIVAGFAQMGMLGALLTFAPDALYAVHALAPFDWGLTPLADQQLGGILMWVPAGFPYAVAAAVVARRGWGRLRAETV